LSFHCGPELWSPSEAQHNFSDGRSAIYSKMTNERADVPVALHALLRPNDSSSTALPCPAGLLPCLPAGLLLRSLERVRYGTPGLTAADVLAYLKSWDVLSPRPTEAEQASLFETQAERLNATKLATIREILDLIKHVEVVS